METKVVFAGMACHTVSGCVVGLPLRFEIFCVYVMLLPALTGLGEAELVVNSRSSAQVTWSVAALVGVLQVPFVAMSR